MRFTIVLTFAAFILSCQSPEPPPKAKKKVEKKVVPERKKKVLKKNPDLITNRNVEERLLAYGEKNPETLVLIKTDKGDIKVRLYKDTPLHRANFILMAKNGCFNNNVFTRVSPLFMAQAGGTYDEEITAKRNSIGRYSIPAEIKTKYFHKKGSIGAARGYLNNPRKRSNPFAFYLVEGSTYNDLTLDKYEEENNYTYPTSHREYYYKNPGAAHIDGQHTVFGEIVQGFDVVPKITSVKRDSRDWPITDIYVQEVIVLN